MKLLTREQSRELDRIAIDKMGIPSIELMGKAGSAVAENALKLIAKVHAPKIAIICGKGNNAGDGYKAAIDLQKIGLNPQVFILYSKSDIIGDSLIYYKKCLSDNISVEHSLEPPERKFDLIIDAIFGTGFVGKVKHPILDYTKWINNQNTLVLSVDVPSGINANNGNVAENAIMADATVTMGMTKVGMTLEPGKSHCGDIIPVDIGFPDIYDELTGVKFRLEDRELAYKYLVAPNINTHKHKKGKLLILAGSRGMTGAAILASNSAIRSGAGLVTTFAPSSLNNIYETNIIEGLTISCKDDEKGYFNKNNYAEIEEYFSWSDSLLIGPGLGRNESTKELVKKIVKNYTKSLLIDADGLRCFTNNLELFDEIRSDYIITPHYGELACLLNLDTAEISKNIIEFLQTFMDKYKGILVAKNAPTLVAHKNEIVVNSTGNQGLATGGTGDVLSGVIASFLAQGVPAPIAAELGVFIHGMAADNVAEQKGFRGLIASDILDMLPQTIMAYEQKII